MRQHEAKARQREAKARQREALAPRENMASKDRSDNGCSSFARLYLRLLYKVV